MSLRPHITFLTRLATFLPLFATIAAFGQQSAGTFRIAGSVTDYATGEPVVGANVVAYDAGGRPHGAAVGADGRFAFNCPTKAATLRVSMLGYRNETVKLVPGRTDYDIRLREAPSDVGEVVVTGFVDKKRESYTGATHVIQRQEIENMVHTNVLNIIQLQTPGFEIFDDIANGSDPNKIPDMVLRGRSSFIEGDQTNVPLFILDGTEVDISYVFDMPSDDIESISVLKDASASAIYGAKASAGVILVTTKKGAAGKATVSYSNNIGWTQPTTPTDFITNGYDYATIVNDLYFSRYAYNAFNYTDADWAALEARRYDTTEHPDRPWVVIGDDGKYHYYGNFDWYHSIYNTNRFHQEHNLSLSGGGKDVNYYVSGRYYQQDGVLGGNMIRNKENYKNYSFRAKFDAQLFKWAKWSTNASLNAVNQKYPGPLNEAQTIAALEENVAPMFVPYNPDGSIVMYPADLRNVALGKGRTAALADPTNKHTIENLSLTLSNSLQLKLHKDLTFDASYNINNYRRLYKDRTAANIYSDAVGVTKTTTHYQKDTYRERPYEYTYHNVDAYFTYEHSWNKEHNFKAVAGMNYEKYRLVDNIVEQFGLGSDQIDSFNSVNDDTYWLVQQDISAYKTLGFFARINYDYKGKYLFEASMRADGTSRFAKKDRWGYFPSVSAGWRFTEEQFMEGVRHWWDNGKIRLSYGALGNQQVSNYLYLQTIGTGTLNYLFDDSGKASYASVSDPMSSNLTWETVYTYNLGLDLSFLQNRLSFTGDFFIRDTKDMLTQSLTLPSVYGAATPTENCADLRTKGWELSITWRDQFKLGGKPFHYALTGQIGDYQTEITKYNNPTKLFDSYYEGKKLGEIWGYHVPKLFDTDEEAAAYQVAINNSSNVYQRVYNMQNNLGKLMAGDVMFEDRDGSGSIGTGAGTVDDPGDMMIIGNTTPRYSYSFRIEASWNGFDISAFFQGVGHVNFSTRTDQTQGFIARNSREANLFSDVYDNYWTPERLDAKYPRLFIGTNNNNNQNSSFWMANGRYMRLKNLEIGYTLPKHISQKMAMQNMRVYLSGVNLFTFSPFKLWDPDLQTGATNYPNNRIINIGLTIGF